MSERFVQNGRGTLQILLLLLLAAIPARAQVSPGPLSAAHAELEGVRHCRDCHGGGDELDLKCRKCHQGIDRSIALERGLHAREGKTDCGRCHPEHAGRDFALIDWGDDGERGFDHARTGWPLEGRHAPVECAHCHRPENRVRALALRLPGGPDSGHWIALDRNCSGCHADIHESRLGKNCAQCHRSSGWDETPGFDHAQTAFPLRGRHAKLECKACHAPGRFAQPTHEKATLALYPLAHGQCSACHQDVHEGRFGPDCARCHVEEDFHRIDGQRFDHDATRYPLRGAHRNVECARCHRQEKGKKLAHPRFDRCDRCHADAHAGTATRAGQAVDCERCHRVAAFRPSTFDVAAHEEVWPLVGAHREVECGKCHVRAPVSEVGPAGVRLRRAHELCADCHQDPHGAQLASLREARCDACHGLTAFVPSTWGPEEHARTGFVLDGAHAEATCSRCHRPSGRRGLAPLAAEFDLGKAAVALALPEQRCEDCHADPHQGRYDHPPHQWGCERCHSTTRFRPSTIGIEDHARFAFDLQGAHRATPCFLCHRELTEPSAIAEGARALVGEILRPVVLWEVPSACEACHRDGVPVTGGQ